jgi:hypothetical protein
MCWHSHCSRFHRGSTLTAGMTRFLSRLDSARVDRWDYAARMKISALSVAAKGQVVIRLRAKARNPIWPPALPGETVREEGAAAQAAATTENHQICACRDDACRGRLRGHNSPPNKNPALSAGPDCATRLRASVRTTPCSRTAPAPPSRVACTTLFSRTHARARTRFARPHAPLRFPGPARTASRVACTTLFSRPRARFARRVHHSVFPRPRPLRAGLWLEFTPARAAGAPGSFVGAGGGQRAPHAP